MTLAIQYETGTAMASESSYPYRGRDGSCKSNFQSAIPSGGITGHRAVSQNKNSMKSAIQQQPVSIAIQADQYSFQQYSTGVLDSGCGTQLDHGVLAVGYGTERGEDYWLVKNSWGTSWGQNGYIKIGSATNVCGVLDNAVYPQASGGRPGPSPGPSPAPSPSPHGCTDMAGWMDQEGETCALFAYNNYCTADGREGSNWNRSWGSLTDYYDRHGNTPADACCACGGGNRREDVTV